MALHNLTLPGPDVEGREGGCVPSPWLNSVHYLEHQSPDISQRGWRPPRTASGPRGARSADPGPAPSGGPPPPASLPRGAGCPAGYGSCPAPGQLAPLPVQYIKNLFWPKNTF
jgi:hypothetical protein